MGIVSDGGMRLDALRKRLIPTRTSTRTGRAIGQIRRNWRAFADRLGPEVRWHTPRLRTVTRLRSHAKSCGARNRLRRESAARLAELTSGLEVGVRHRAALARRIRRLPPPRRASRQFVEWSNDVTFEDLGASRFVVQPTGAETIPTSTLIPLLMSGRPVVTADGSGSLAVTTAARASDSELAKVALDQLRDRLTPQAPHLTVVLASNRADYLVTAVEQIQRQEGVRIELQLGLHGIDATALDGLELEHGAVEGAAVSIFGGDEVFGEILERLSARATSSVVTKWDDDDRYGASHLIDLWIAMTLTGAPLIGKAAEFVLLEEEDLLVERPGGRLHTTTRYLAGGAIMTTRTALEIAGGWPPIARRVDQELLDRFSHAGLQTVRTHGIGFVHVRHPRAHTWEVERNYFMRTATSGWASPDLTEIGIGSAQPESKAADAKTEPRISVCIPNRNDSASLRRWEFTTPEQVQLVICDDRSTPALRPSSPTTLVVRLDDGEGFGAGRARHAAAAAACDADVLIFADADMELHPDVLAAVSQHYANGETGVVHGVLDFSPMSSGDASRIAESHGTDQLHRRLSAGLAEGQIWRRPHLASSSDLARPRSSSYRATIGGFLAIDRPTYEQTGGFRPVTIRGVEDTEFGYRVQATGCAQYVLRMPGIVHLGATTRSSRLNANAARLRQELLSAWVPIWANSLRERLAITAGLAVPVVPFVAVSESSEVVPSLGDHVTRWTPHSREPMTDPFCVAVELDPHNAGAAIATAYETFRSRPGGEVQVILDDRIIGRFIALWAVAHAGRLGGVEAAELDPFDSSVQHLVRRHTGLTWGIAIDSGKNSR